VGCNDWFDGATRKSVHYRGIEATVTEASLPAIPQINVPPPGTSCGWSVRWTAATDPRVEIRGSTSVTRTATMQ
jgi:hypothetical protein